MHQHPFVQHLFIFKSLSGRLSPCTLTFIVVVILAYWMNSKETPCIERASPCSHIVVVSSLLDQHQTESSYIQPSILLYLFIYICIVWNRKEWFRNQDFLFCFVLFLSLLMCPNSKVSESVVVSWPFPTVPPQSQRQIAELSENLSLSIWHSVKIAVLKWVI